jgi:hypothetical protein
MLRPVYPRERLLVAIESEVWVGSRPGLDVFGSVAYPEIFFGGVQQIQLRTEGRENRDLGVVDP